VRRKKIEKKLVKPLMKGVKKKNTPKEICSPQLPNLFTKGMAREDQKMGLEEEEAGSSRQAFRKGRKPTLRSSPHDQGEKNRPWEQRTEGRRRKRKIGKEKSATDLGTALAPGMIAAKRNPSGRGKKPINAVIRKTRQSKEEEN